MLENKVVKIIWSPPASTNKTIRATLMWDKIVELDNIPMGFDSVRECALFDIHCINVLDIDSNRWETIPINSIVSFIH